MIISKWNVRLFTYWPLSSLRFYWSSFSSRGLFHPYLTIYPLWKNDSFFSFSHRSLYLLCYFCNQHPFGFWLFPLALLWSLQWYLGIPFHVCVLSKRPYLVHRLCIWSGSLSLKKRLLIGHLYFLMYLCQKFPRWSLQPDVSLERLE